MQLDDSLALMVPLSELLCCRQADTKRVAPAGKWIQESPSDLLQRPPKLCCKNKMEI